MRCIVRLRGDVECYKLDKDDFSAILHRRLQIAEDISHVLAHRRLDRRAFTEGLNSKKSRVEMF